ncbi:MAG TPA: hypothetical protein VE996_02085 [Terriglobales bacterium]|nr:hypothetical protein [Terriglobales bacterium]
MTPPERPLPPAPLDQELRQALRALAAEPPAGFEARLLARLAAVPARRPGAAWLPALAACGALALAFAVAWRARPPRPAVGARAAARVFTVRAAPPRLRYAAALPAPRRAGRRLLATRLRRARRALALRAAARRFPAQFPTPTPPSPSELALLRFLRTAPPGLVAQAFQPLEIAPLWPDKGDSRP